MYKASNRDNLLMITRSSMISMFSGTFQHISIYRGTPESLCINSFHLVQRCFLKLNAVSYLYLYSFLQPPVSSPMIANEYLDNECIPSNVCCPMKGPSIT